MNASCRKPGTRRSPQSADAGRLRGPHLVSHIAHLAVKDTFEQVFELGFHGVRISSLFTCLSGSLAVTHSACFTRVATLIPNATSCLRLVMADVMDISDDWETGRTYQTMDEK